MTVRRERGRKAVNTPQDRPVDTAGDSNVDIVELSLFDTMADDSRVVVWRRNPATKKPIFLYPLAREEATEMRIQELSGGGYYITREQVRNQSGQYVWGRQRSFEVAGASRDPVIPSPSVEVKTTPLAVNGPVGVNDILGAGILQLFNAMNEVNTANRMVLQSVLERKGPDWTTLITALAPIVAPLLAGRDRRDPVEIAKEIAEVMRRDTSKASGMQEVVEAVKSMLELRDMVDPGRGSDEGSDPLMKALPDLTRVILEEHEARKARGAMTEPVRSGPVAGRGTVAAPSPVPPKIASGARWQQALLANKARIIRFAQEGNDPDQCAEMVLTFIPGMRGLLREAVLDTEVISKVFDAVPELAAYPEWVAGFFGAVSEILLPTEEEDDEPSIDSSKPVEKSVEPEGQSS